MPRSTPDITLDIRIGGSNDPGWRNVSVNGQQYGYLYSGGDDGQGGLVMRNSEGRDTAPLRLVADQRYQITDVQFTSDTEDQLSWQGNSGRAGTIVDANTKVELAEYAVMVSDTGNNGVVIQCDPPVRNQPG